MAELGKGPRLFEGDHYVLARKHGAPQKALQKSVTDEPMIFTVTETSGGDGSTFVRIQYQCPRGVYVETRRAEDIQDSNESLILPAHKHLTLARRVGESFLIRPFAGREEGAAKDLFGRHVLVRAEENAGDDKSTVHIFASDCWEILRAELVPGLVGEVGKPEKADEISLSAFRHAAEKLLDQQQIAEIEDLARALNRQMPSWRP